MAPPPAVLGAAGGAALATATALKLVAGASTWSALAVAAVVAAGVAAMMGAAAKPTPIASSGAASGAKVGEPSGKSAPMTNGSSVRRRTGIKATTDLHVASTGSAVPRPATAAAAATVRVPVSSDAAPSRQTNEGAGDWDQSQHDQATSAAAEAATNGSSSEPTATAAATDELACPPGFDAAMFAQLPPDMQKEAIRNAERKAKADKAKAERAASGKSKSKGNGNKAGGGGGGSRNSSASNSPKRPIQGSGTGANGATTTVSSSAVDDSVDVIVTEACEVPMPTPLKGATSPAARSLNTLLEEMRDGGLVLEMYIGSEDLRSLFGAANNLMKLQLKFDSIDPDGDSDVRAKRKECVKALNQLLDKAEKRGWKTSTK
eukprot:m.19129 g.19129  ORF g.19129 m.19129 type:complete len:376 (-) comp3663_c1_seq2:224-1351(-)